jgi:ABC-2 type transport system ATP-binding protein
MMLAPELGGGPPPVEGAPVLEAVDARIAVDDVVAIERLDVRTVGDRVLCVGDVQALMAAITGAPLRATGAELDPDDAEGEARVVAGSLRVGGRRVETGEHHEVMGAAPLDPPLPLGSTVLDYVTWSARLAGTPKRLARELATTALTRMGLGSAGARLLGTLSVAERRVVVLTQAVVTAPAVVVAEAPLAGLDPAAANAVSTALARATEGRRALVSVSRIDPGTAEGSLARAASQVLLLSGGELVIEGTAADVFSGSRIYGLTVRSNAEPLRAELMARGIELRGGPLRFCAALPPGSTTGEVLAAAVAARAAVVELVPLI